MDNLSRFYIDLATNANKMHAFNLANAAEKELMLTEAGVDNAVDLVSKNQKDLAQVMASELVAATGSWLGLDKNVPNDDNKNNIGRLGIRKDH